MAPPLRATAEAESSAAVASLAATVPASVQAGDFIVVVAGASSSNTFNSTLAATVGGYTNRANERAGSAAFRLGVWTKVAAGTEGGTTVTPTLSTGTGRMVVQVRVYHSVDTTTPLDATTTIDSSDVESTNVPAPAITTVTPGAWTVSIHGMPSTSGTTITSWTDPATSNNELISCSTDGTGNQAAVASYDYDNATAGVKGPYTAVSTQSRRWASVTLALRPGATSIAPRATFTLGATETVSSSRTRSPSAGLELGATAVISKEITVAPTVGITLDATADIEPVQSEDLEVTLLVARDDGWRPVQDQTLAAKWLASDAQDERVWRLFLDADGGGDPALAGRLALAWSSDGTAASVVTAYATDRAPVDPLGRVQLRVFLDVNNGSGGWTVVFEYLDENGDWAAIGDPVTGSPSSVLHPSSTAETSVGGVHGRDPLNANPYFETDATDWFAAGGAVTRSTAQFHQGVASLLLTPSGVDATSRAQITTFEPVTELVDYTVSTWVRCAVSRNMSIDIEWYDADQVFTTTSTPLTTAVVANTWTLVTQTWTAPAGTAFARPRFYMTGTPPANNLLYLDEAQFTEVDNFAGRAYSFQVRVGRTGDILASVDFTDHAAGTEMFTDDTGNDWDVHPAASLSSSQELTSVAILGPLATDECAEWTDFTLPRSGVGATCEHQPGECCSYYRARTIVREDGQLLVSDWSAGSGEELFCLTWDEDEHLIRTTGPDGPIYAVVWGKFEWSVDRPFTAATGVMGSRFVTSAPPGGRDLSMVAAVENEAELATLRAVLARPLVLVSPSDANEVWAAPVAESVRIVKVGRIRQVTASFIGTGPQPPPQTADVGT